jgi:elongation factor 1-beta
MSELRTGEDRAMRALPRPIRVVSLPDLFVHRAVRCAMGSVAITFRIMPEDADTDLDSVRSRVRSTLGSALRDLREQPVAFGLKAILAVAIVSDASGGSDLLEQSLAAIPGVGSVESIDVTLV